jgi:hypothetical protein
MAVVKKNVIPMPARPTANAARMSERKWGRDVMEVRNFCLFPSLLLHAQARLKITPTQLALLMHLIDFWWDADRKPWPRKALLAERVGLSSRHVQRQIAELEALGLVKRNERFSRSKGKLSNEYDLSGLVERLKQLAPEFKAADEQARKKAGGGCQARIAKTRGSGRRRIAYAA